MAGKNTYFTKDTEEAVLRYCASTCERERNRIFSRELYYPFYKLAENLIHTYKFQYLDVDKVEDLKCEIVSMIAAEKLPKFNPAVGAKAYSYFGTIIKRWLITYSDKNYKRLKSHVEFQETEYDTEVEIERDSSNDVQLQEVLKTFYSEVESRLYELFESELDRTIAQAIITVFKHCKHLDITKKKALYIYIREIVSCRSQDITHVLNILKPVYSLHIQGYLEANKEIVVD